MWLIFDWGHDILMLVFDRLDLLNYGQFFLCLLLSFWWCACTRISRRLSLQFIQAHELSKNVLLHLIELVYSPKQFILLEHIQQTSLLLQHSIEKAIVVGQIFTQVALSECRRSEACVEHLTHDPDWSLNFGSLLPHHHVEEDNILHDLCSVLSYLLEALVGSHSNSELFCSSLI